MTDVPHTTALQKQKQRTVKKGVVKNMCIKRMNKLFEVFDDTLVDTHAKIFHSAPVASENDGRAVVGNLTLRLGVTV